MLNKRTQILFENDFWNQLMSLAKARDMSVGELVRSTLKATYFKEDKKEKMARGMKMILSVRKKFKKIDYKEMINYGRKY